MSSRGPTLSQLVQFGPFSYPISVKVLIDPCFESTRSISSFDRFYTLEEFIRRLFICCQTRVGTLLRLCISGICI
ncbi:hypothetical protein LINGRAHAP2_LOCUS11536 [Linum grandiflorum]